MKIVVAPNAFKGSLTAAAAASAIADGFAAALPDATLDLVPVADGGDGTLDALVTATGGRQMECSVTGPDGAPVYAAFGMLGDGCTAVVELAKASGLTLVPPGTNDPRTATTRGTGELIAAAIQAGAKRIVLAIGGSATNDGGAGALSALGARFLDARDQRIPCGGTGLRLLERVETQTLKARLEGVKIDIAGDVSNPLCGPNGAAAVYGPQKGATPDVVRELDQALARFADIVARQMGVDMRDVPGAGAAGGVGFGFLALAGAQLQPGAQLVLSLLNFTQHVRGAALVVTGEGRLDRQTASGKAPFAVAQAARAQDVPAIAIAGSIDCTPDDLKRMGFVDAVALVDERVTVAQAQAQAPQLLRAAAERLAKCLPFARD